MTDLLELAGRDVVLTQRGQEWHGPCPFCRDGRDRFVVWSAKDQYWCRVCDRKGDALQYLRERDGLSFAEAKAALGLALEPTSAPRRPAPPPAPRDDPPAEAWQARARAFVAYAQQQLWGTTEGAAALRYLRDCRGLTDATIRAWGLGYSPRDLYDAPERWGLDPAANSRKVWCARGVVVPCDFDGVLWYVTVRRPMLAAGEPDELARYVGGGKDDAYGKYIRPRGFTAALLGAHTLPGQSVVVVTEGELDAILLHQETGAGVATMGGVKTPLTARWLLSLAEAELVLAAHDADPEGDAGAAALERMSPRVKRARPIGAKDLDAMRRAGRDLREWLGFYRRLHSLDEVPTFDGQPERPVDSDEPASFLDEVLDHDEAGTPDDVAAVLSEMARAEDPPPPVPTAPSGPWDDTSAEVLWRSLSPQLADVDLEAEPWPSLLAALDAAQRAQDWGSYALAVRACAAAAERSGGRA